MNTFVIDLNKEVLYKFRTMTDARDENGELLDDAPRLTGYAQVSGYGE